MISVFTLATSFVIGLSSSVAAQSSTVDTLEAQAYIWMQRGRADKAAEAWRKLLLTQPQHSIALSELAVYAVSVGALEEAQQRLSDLEKADPRDGRLAFVRAMMREGDQVATELREARLLSKAGRVDAALKHYWKAFGKTEPTTLSGLEYFQVLTAAADGWNSAHVGLERLAGLYPKAAHVQLVLALHLTYVDSTRTRGIQLLEQLTGMPAVSSEAHVAWRQAVKWLGESPNALPLLRAYVNANPQDNELRSYLEQLEPRLGRQVALRQAYQALKAGKLDQAEEKFMSIPDADLDTEVLVGLASISLAREDFDQAVKLLDQVRELAPQQPKLWQPLLRTAELWQAIKRADSLRSEGQLNKAQTLLEHAATSDATERYQAVLALIEVLLDRGDLPGARHNLYEQLNAPPTDTAGLRRLVSLLLRADLDDEAATTNEALRNIDTSFAFSPEGLQAEQLRLQAIHLRQAGDFITARDTLMVAAGIDPHASQVWLDLVNLELEFGDLDKAQHSIEALLAAEPGLPEAVLAEARIAEQRGEYDRSLELLGTIAASASSVEINNLRQRLEVRLASAKAVRYFRTGGVSAAHKQLSELEKAALSSTNLAIVAEAWANIGEPDHAVLLLQHAGDTSLAEVQGVRLQMAGFLLRVGRTGEAKAVLNELSTQPGLAPAELSALQKLRVGCAVRVADSLRSQGDLAGARKELAPWIEIRPLNPQVANAYGRVLYDAGDYVAAAGQYARVLKQDTTNLEALQGFTYAALDGGVDLREARRTLQKGLQVRDRDPRLHLLMARLNARAKKNSAALKELAKASRLVENEMHSDTTLTSNENTTNRLPSQARQPEAELEQLRSEIQSETQRIRVEVGPKFRPEITMRSRQGVPGRNELFEMAASSRLELPSSWGTLSLQVIPTQLSAGQLALGPADTMPFGTVKWDTPDHDNPQDTLQDTLHVYRNNIERNIEAEGLAFEAGYRFRGLQLDIGVTPLNFLIRSTIIGDLRWKIELRNVTLELEASRQAVDESVLSFAGISDDSTGSVWGGVLKQGGAMTFRHDGRNSRSYAVIDYKYLTGTNVKSNNSIAANLGLLWEVQRIKSTHLETGIAVSAMAFQHNLSGFSYGHGGYFSPQHFVHFGLPVDWQGNYQAMTWQLNLEPGVTWFQIDDAPYFPLAPPPPTTTTSVKKSKPVTRYPSRSSLGLGVDGGLELSYALTPQMILGAQAKLHTGADYSEIYAFTFLRFALKGGGRQPREY